MIVDVMSLHLRRLLFTGGCDYARNSRGRELYARGKATVTRVDSKGDGTYDIDGVVEGNNADYDVSLVIRGDKVIGMSCNCMDFISSRPCKHLIALKDEVVSPHYASTLEGVKKQQLEREEEERRREEERKKEEYERIYADGLMVIRNYQNINKKGDTNMVNLFTMEREVENEKNGKEVISGLKLEYFGELTGEGLCLHFKIGKTRMYNLGNVFELYNAYVDETELSYGKQLCFVPKRENFEEGSRELFDFIIEYAKTLWYTQNYTDVYYRHYIRNNIYKCPLIIGENIEKFFDIVKKSGNILNIKTDNGMELYRFTSEKLDIYCQLKQEVVSIPRYENPYSYMPSRYDDRAEYVLSLNIDDFSIISSSTFLYFFVNNRIYTTKFDQKLRDTLNVFSNDDKILIPEDKLDDIRKYVLPNVYYKEEELPEIIRNKGVFVEKLASKILLDVNEEGAIELDLRFFYQDKEYSALRLYDSNKPTPNGIVRDIPTERDTIKRILSDGFRVDYEEMKFVMFDTYDMYVFLKEKIQGYMDDYEVLVTDRFKNKQIKKAKISNIGVKIDNGLLEVDFSKINIDLDEIKDILRNYNVKKKYYELKNGDILDLTEDEDLKLLDEMAITLDVDYSKMNTAKLTLPVSRSIYLEKLLESNNQIVTQKNDEFNKFVDSIESPESVDESELDDVLKEKLREYQKVGFRWLKTLEKYKFGGILADDMGLGKTLQIIAVIQSEAKKKEKTTSIVVCPSTLVLNWQAEVEKWCKSIKVLIITGSAAERKRKIEKIEKYDLVITSYDLLKRDIAEYEDQYFKYIIADEAQYIKNSNTQNATSLKSLKGEVKYALTGTPIENSVAELWSIFDFIMPGYLYNYNRFKKKFEEPILKDENKEALVRLKKLISPFILRRIKKDVLTELPEKTITVLKNEMKPEQEKMYMAYLAQTKKEVASEISQSGFEKSKFKILSLLTRLRQICCHPSVFVENYDGGSGKLEQCIDLISEAIASEHKILLFSSYTSIFELIEKELKKLDINYFKLIGDTQISKRIEMVDEFNKNDNVKVFLISLKAGGTGLNLTSADIVIHFDPWWNLSIENQATDRAYRIGQKNNVQVYKLITSNSIEEKINQMQERKEKLSKDVLSTEETFISKLSKDEILDLFE